MGCNCGKSKQGPIGAAKPKPDKSATGQRQTFRLEFDSGESFDFGSRLEAEAARIRNGRRGQVRPV